MSDKPEAAIFDLDGVLRDVSSVRHHVTQRPKNFDAFYVGAATCPANQVWLADVEWQRAYGRSIIVLTGGPDRYRPLVQGWLHRNGVRVDELVTRGDDDYRPGHVYKREKLAELSQRYEIVAAWDDDARITDMYALEGVPLVVRVPGWAGSD